MWWAVTDQGEVSHVKGYSCGATNPDYWWVPQLGYSMSSNHHLFASQEQAHAAATKLCTEKLAEWKSRLSKLQ